MTKCDFCKYSELVHGELKCTKNTPQNWCGDAIETMVKALGNNTKDKRRKNAYM